MQKILIASENLGKLKEFQELLGDRISCATPIDPTLKRKCPLLVTEDGETYYENALKKALAYYKTFKLPVLADDSGLEVEPLGNAPGVYTARFGGEGLTWPERWEHLLRTLAPFPQDSWRARFRCVLCYYDGVRVPIFFEGTADGKILSESRGSHGFGYDPIFFSTPLKKSFAEASSQEKHQHSHRAVAVRHFLTWYQGKQASV